MSNLLSVEKLTMKFGGLVAIDDLSFDAKNNQITSIIGPNGAGKTTFMDIITGQTKPDNGHILWGEKSIDLIRKTESEIALLGIGRKFQKPTVFENKTIIDNLILSQKKNRNPFKVLFQKNTKYQLLKMLHMHLVQNIISKTLTEKT